MDFYERQELTNQEDRRQAEAEKAIEEKLSQAKEGNEDENRQEGEKKNPPFKDMPRPKAIFSANKEIDFSQDWGFFVVIMFSIIADFFGLLPYVGGFFGFFFSIIIFVIYLLSGQLKNRTFAKVAIILITDFLESIGGAFLIDLLPLFSVSAILIYWLELSYRRARRIQSNEE